MAKLNSYVHVQDEDGNIVVLEPGQDLPTWAKDKVGKHALTPAKDDEDVIVAGPGQTAAEAKRQANVEASRAAREAKAKADAEEAAKAAAGGKA